MSLAAVICVIIYDFLGLKTIYLKPHDFASGGIKTLAVRTTT